MVEFTVFNVAVQAEQLRNAQKASEQQFDRYLKTFDKGDWELAVKFKNIALSLQLSFDDTIARIMNSKLQEND